MGLPQVLVLAVQEFVLQILNLILLLVTVDFDLTLTKSNLMNNKDTSFYSNLSLLSYTEFLVAVKDHIMISDHETEELASAARSLAIKLGHCSPTG